MRYHMHKRDQLIEEQRELEEVLREGRYMTLALCRANEPYVVTLSYAYDGEQRALYFHTALEGLKLAFIEGNPAVCGTVIEDHGYQEGRCSHAYRSVVVWGDMGQVTDPDEKRRCMLLMVDQLEADPTKMRRRLEGRNEGYDRVTVLRLDIREMSGRVGT